MTAPRPGGSTSKGLRYPGNDITVDEIPAAIHNLALDVDRNLGQASGVAVAQLLVNVTLDANGGTATIQFTTLASVTGCVVNWGQDNFGPGIIIDSIIGNQVIIKAPLTVPYISPPVHTPNTGAPVGTYNPQYVKGRAVNVMAIAWGTPK